MHLWIIYCVNVIKVASRFAFLYFLSDKKAIATGWGLREEGLTSNELLSVR
jgi:hypothetical protein